MRRAKPIDVSSSLILISVNLLHCHPVRLYRACCKTLPPPSCPPLSASDAGRAKSKRSPASIPNVCYT